MNNTATEALPNRYDANASFWVQIIREHRDRYRNEVTDPAMLHAIGEPAGLDVLDAGCAGCLGEGLEIVLARRVIGDTDELRLAFFGDVDVVHRIAAAIIDRLGAFIARVEPEVVEEFGLEVEIR